LKQLLLSRLLIVPCIEQAETKASTYAAQIQLIDLSKQVEAMKRPFDIYGSSQPDPALSVPGSSDSVPVEVDVAVYQSTQQTQAPIAVASSKRALNSLFRPQPETEPVAGPSAIASQGDDDVFAHLPPPSPAFSYVDEPQAQPPNPVAQPVRRSPRKPKPTAPLRLGPKAGAKRKAADEPQDVGGPSNLKRAKTEAATQGSVVAPIRDFSAGIGAASSPKSRLRTKVVEQKKGTKSATAVAKGKGKERITALKPSGTTAQKQKQKVQPEHAQPPLSVELDMPSSPKPVLPTFVLPPPSPASRLPSMQIPQIPNEVGSLPVASTTPNDDQNPFITSLSPATAATSPPAPASIEHPLPPSNNASSAPLAPMSSAAPSAPFAPAPSLPPPVPSVPESPSRHLFPPYTGRPIAPHMVHAYSPVKPSPLSRILMLAESPDSPEEPPIPRLGALVEQDEPADEMDVDADNEDVYAPVSPTPAKRTRRSSLAQELGALDDDTVGDVVGEDEASDTAEADTLVGGKAKAQAKGKAKEQQAQDASKGGRGAKYGLRPAPTPKPRSPGMLVPLSAHLKPKEKENPRQSPRGRVKPSAQAGAGSSASSSSSTEGRPVRLLTGRKRSTVIGGGIMKTRSSARTVKAKVLAAKASSGPGADKSTTPAIVPPLQLKDLEPPSAKDSKETRLKGKSRGGPKRVPIDSADAAPANIPAWRG
jgi:hypothetical protein